MMNDLETRILETVNETNYRPLKAKKLAIALGVVDSQYPQFQSALRALVDRGRLTIGTKLTVRSADPLGSVVGIFRRLSSGAGTVRTTPTTGPNAQEYAVADYRTSDAATGDEVLARVIKRPSRIAAGIAEVLTIQQRATKQFVGTFFLENGDGRVRVDGTIFPGTLFIGDASTKGAQPDDKVVVEVLRFPTVSRDGEAVITEILGKRGVPRVDTVATIRSLGIPDVFPEEVIAESRKVASQFVEDDLGGREDFTNQLVITVDPIDAKDFDDAVSLRVDPQSKHCTLTVHIADVSHFVRPGGELDREARKRGTSVYLPQQVIPMFPELISNGLASLQEGKLRYVKTVEIEFTATGQRVATRFANGAIRSKKRFAYEQVSEILAAPTGERALATDPAIVAMLGEMKTLALHLRKRRAKRGALEMEMPTPVLEYDKTGRVAGAHFAIDDISHQIIEEFMLAANEAVASHFSALEVPFLRRIHPAPDPLKLKSFAQFSALLGYPLDGYQDRFELQRILRETATKPERHAIHYALLRSLKQAKYSPDPDEHFALATREYCHFTSPIRRYPDLLVHRLLGQWLDRGRASSDLAELRLIGDQCSKNERRAEVAEREVVKLRLINFLAENLGTELDCVITGVAEYGFYALGEVFPAEGLVHVRTLENDHYVYDEASHTLEGKRQGRRFRLGDKVKVEVVRADPIRRQLDFRVVSSAKSSLENSRKKTKKKDRR